MKHKCGRHPLHLLAAIILTTLLVIAVIGCGSTSPGKLKTQAEKIFQQANKTYDQMNYTEAASLYEQDLPQPESEANQEDTDACRMQLYNSQLYPLVYPYGDPPRPIEAGPAITVTCKFTRSEQRFRVDPANIGAYETSDPEYKEYTASSGNIEITPEIAQTAQQVVGGETNSYNLARLLHDCVINNINYSFMPHPVLWPRGQAESVYVQKYSRGDCGAQSIYFSVLCRSLGIPARATGGFQLFSGDFGTHFWTEFCLPNYGWVPADTSVAQLALYPADLTQEQRQAWLDFYFANMDSMRCVVQKNVDEHFIPTAGPEPQVLMPMAVQTVEARCDTMTTMPDLVLSEGFQIHAKKL